MCRQYQQQLQDPKTNRLQKITIGNRLRLVLFLPHPNAHMKKEERQALEVAKGGFISEIQYLLTTSEFSA
jgi:hypothetical protein